MRRFEASHVLPVVTSIVCLVWAVGCGGAASGAGMTTTAGAAPTAGATTTAETSPVSEPGASSDAAAALAASAPFSSLVDAIRRRDDHRDQDRGAGCLLRANATVSLEADLAVSVRPTPVPPDDLDALLDERRDFVVLTRSGVLGLATPEKQGFVAMTTTLPHLASARLVVVTDRGVRIVDEGGRITAGDASYPPDAPGLGWFVTAEAGVPISSLVTALRRLPDAPGRIGLAVSLPLASTLPPPLAPEPQPTAARCEGLPETSEPEGDLAVATLLRGAEGLRFAVALCAGETQGAGAAGSRLELLFRVAADGHARDACVRADSADDAVLRACVAQAANRLVFSAPTGGVVDVALPLVIEPAAAYRQTPLCVE